MSPSKIQIIIPTYNEKENLPVLIERIFSLSIPNIEVLIVDDNSPDGTGRIADELSRKYDIKVIHRPSRLGFGSAHILGFKIAIESEMAIVITMDADLSHNPEDIPRMLKEIAEGYDVAVGSRKIPGGKIIGWNWWRHFCSDGASWFSRLMLDLKTKDVTAGFRAFRIETLKKLPLNKIKSDGYAFLEELIYLIEKSHFKVKEIPVTFLDRRQGKSKLSSKEIIKFFLTILRLKFKGGS